MRHFHYCSFRALDIGHCYARHIFAEIEYISSIVYTINAFCIIFLDMTNGTHLLRRHIARGHATQAHTVPSFASIARFVPAIVIVVEVVVLSCIYIYCIPKVILSKSAS